MNTETNDEQLFPVSQLEVGPIFELGGVVIKPHYMTSVEDFETGDFPARPYVMTIAQAKELVRMVSYSIDRLEGNIESTTQSKH